MEKTQNGYFLPAQKRPIQELKEPQQTVTGWGRLNEDTRGEMNGEEDEKLSCLLLGPHSQKSLLVHILKSLEKSFLVHILKNPS